MNIFFSWIKEIDDQHYQLCEEIQHLTAVVLSIHTYRMEGNFGGGGGRGNVGEFGELSVICQTKTIQISTYH